MRTNQILRYPFWATLYCLIFIVLSSDEDLADFDFADLKEIDWNYDTEQIVEQTHNTAGQSLIKSSAKIVNSEEENQIYPFDWRENILRSALSKALTNASLRQKFVEVMPILRVLSSQQRLALSALISAQIGAKGDNGLRLKQVQTMFGNDEKLLLPIVFDIANLVRSSARKYLDFELDVPAHKPNEQHITIDRRIDDLHSVELAEIEHDTNSELALEDFFSETGEEMLDPQSINEELQEAASKRATPPINTTNIISSNITPTNISFKIASTNRTKREVVAPEFVHKLIRSMPLSIDEDNNNAENNVKLNTSGFLSSKDLSINPLTSTTTNMETFVPINQNKQVTGSHFPSTQSYQQVEDFAFASLNGTAVDLQVAAETPIDALDEPLPSPEELIAGPRYRISSRPKPPTVKRKRVQASRIRSKIAAQNNIGRGGNGVAPPKKCERFTSSMCIRTEDYPLDQIMGSIRRHKNAMTALWADYHEKPAQLDITDDFDEYSIRRREDDATGGGMCQSIVRYARPQKARSASGEWKYIVNTGQHTQTLRLEKCTTPQESCSYLTHSYRSHCAQVYNYHRLLSWDKTRGLHVDIFKVPTCCSCQVDGFRQQFPPFSGSKVKDFTPAVGAEVYSTINEELDYNDEQDEDGINYRFNSGFNGKHKKHDTGYDNNELLLGSQSVRAKLHSPIPTLGSYLSPPSGEEDDSSVSAAKNSIGDSVRRRPYKSLGTANVYNEARVDLDFSPSELHPEKEVNLSGGSLANPNKRVPQKRQRIHSVPHTATVSTLFTKAEKAGPTISTFASNFPMEVGITTPATTTDARGVIGFRGGIATYPYQTSAPGSGSNRASQKQVNNSKIISSVYRNRQIASNSGKKQKTRFHSATPTTSPAPAAAAEPSPIEHSKQWSVFEHKQSPPAQSSRAPPYHVNSVYRPEYDAKNVGNDIEINLTDSQDSVQTSSGHGTKRINYSYHPIIDFFENHKYSAAAAIPDKSKEVADRNGHIFPYTITKYQTPDQSEDLNRYQPHERRIGFGAITGSEKSGLVLRDRTGSSAEKINISNTDENTWHPVVVKTVELS